MKATDVSEHGLQSVRRFTSDAEALDIFDVIPKRPDLHKAFDFTLCWGVLIHTHDPKLAFANAAATVKEGGALYMSVYAPTYHASDFVRTARRHYHRDLRTPEERLAFAYELTEKCNNGSRDNAINELDMLNTFYNWTIEESTIRRWCADNGFKEVLFLNREDPDLCHHHVLAKK